MVVSCQWENLENAPVFDLFNSFLTLKNIIVLGYRNIGLVEREDDDIEG